MPKTKQIKPYRFKRGQSGNPKGRPKGSKSLWSIVRELEDEEFDWSKLPIKNDQALQEFMDQFQPVGAPFRVIVFKAMLEAIKGDVKAMEWLRKAGYGDKIDVTSLGKKIESPLIISTIKPRDAEAETETTEGT